MEVLNSLFICTNNVFSVLYVLFQTENVLFEKIYPNIHTCALHFCRKQALSQETKQVYIYIIINIKYFVFNGTLHCVNGEAFRTSICLCIYCIYYIFIYLSFRSLFFNENKIGVTFKKHTNKMKNTEKRLRHKNSKHVLVIIPPLTYCSSIFYVFIIHTPIII